MTSRRVETATMTDAPAKSGLTERQSQVLAFLREYAADHGGAMPTLAEISAKIGNSSKTTAFYLLEQLIDRGHIRRMGRGKHRSVEIVEGTTAGLERLERWLTANPGQPLTLWYYPNGPQWRAQLKNQVGEEFGYVYDSFASLIDAIVNEGS